VGAANTLVRREDGRIVAHNTDAPALVEELRALAGPDDLRGKRALVLGSGGAARAARVALEALGASVAVRARSESNLAPCADDEASTFAVVQATSAGMTGADPGDAVAAAVAWDALPAAAIALDVVYAPPETPFLRAARARGVRCSNGLGMLARQGAIAFELWLGVPAPLDVMRATLVG
jgi:shikimate dehydrogenase